MATNSEVIHLVHPDSQVLLVLYEVLTAAGYQVAGSSTCPEALEHIARVRPHALLSRREMPDMEGREFLGRVKRVSPLTRVILASPQADESMQREARAWGADDLLPEPFHHGLVLQALEQALGRDGSSEVAVEKPVGLAPHPGKLNPERARFMGPEGSGHA